MPDNVTTDEEARNLVQIGGLIRFSCPFHRPGAGGFRWRFESVADQLDAMYNPARMEERFKYFEKLCLHSLKHQTDSNFTLGVLVGKRMPLVYLDRLKELLSELPQAKLITMPLMPYKRAINRAVAQVFDQNTPYRLSFRLDDDDAVATDFIAQVAGNLPHMLSLSGGVDPVALSFLQKVTLIDGPEGRKMIISVDGHPIGIGLCVLAPDGHKDHAYSYIHSRVQMHMPAVMDSRPLMNFRAYHDSNDSDTTQPKGDIIQTSRDEMELILRARFELDMDEVLAL